MTNNIHDCSTSSEESKEGWPMNVTRLDAINDGQPALGRHETSTPIVANTIINKVEVKTDPAKVSGSRDVKVTHANDAELDKTYPMLYD